MLILIQTHADPDPGFHILTSFTRLETNTEDQETWTPGSVPTLVNYVQYCRV
jgi:hypothetical protein